MPVKDFQSVVVPPKIAGIKTALPAYSLAWLINTSYNIQLSLNLEWQKVNSENTPSFHHHYFCRFEDVELNWHLVQNKGSNMYFFSSKPMFDYLLICNGEDIYGYFEKALESIRGALINGNIFPFGFDILKQKEAYYENFLKTRYFIEDLNV